MKKYCVLFNPYSANSSGEKLSHKLDEILSDCELDYQNMDEIKDFKEFFEKTTDDVIICGGDGTINHFINRTNGVTYNNDVLYFPSGTGNDFHNDVGNGNDKPYSIKKYIEHLPVVTVNGKEYKFINNVGFGIDGYCCERGDELKKKSDKPINYTSIAILGLLFYYKPKNAEVTIDGKTMDFKKVWLCPSMNGRYYGGGMMAAPNQDRLNSDHKVSVVVMHKKNKFGTLIAFPSIFKGEHVKKSFVKVIEGNDIHVKFDKPCALQIDGETILGVTEYSVKTK
ncbi:MAG: diacylglycerol kinase family protein [Clostridia bacterium]|nr:diacylglycerol kinase family protein [Clostridia bacterium]